MFYCVVCALFLQTLNFFTLTVLSAPSTKDPEARMSMPEVISYHGYPFEEYEVKSLDGFYTWIQRIPFGKYNTSRINRKPVIIQHGLAVMAASWVVNIPSMNLAYILAEEGYDVWLTNSRGNSYSLRHEKYKSFQRQFWAHDWHEMGHYDMPAFIDFILKKTGYNQLLYVAHSMGSTIGFVTLSTRPEYNKKVKAAFMMCPVITLNHITSPVRMLNGSSKAIHLIQSMGMYKIDANSPLLKWFFQKTCHLQFEMICKLLVLAFVENDALRFNVTRLPVFAHLNPSSLSVQTLVHFGQLPGPLHEERKFWWDGLLKDLLHGVTDITMNPSTELRNPYMWSVISLTSLGSLNVFYDMLMESRKFQQFDYGRQKNINYYRQPFPPEYNLTAISSPIYLYNSEADKIATIQDADEFAPRLISVKKRYRVSDSLFSHLDFVWGLNVKELVYNELVEDIKNAWP